MMVVIPSSHCANHTHNVNGPSAALIGNSKRPPALGLEDFLPAAGSSESVTICNVDEREM
jgi:hypothetical protein